MKKKLLYVLFITGCTNTNKPGEEKYDIGAKDIASTVVGFESDYAKVWVTDSTGIGKIDRVEIKFQPYISFSDFKVDKTSHSIKAPLQISKESDLWEFRTRIRNGYDAPVNFAGHYCFIMWGCGSSCQLSVIVDAHTGKIYKGPDASIGYDYKNDSRLMIANPPSKESGWVKQGHYNVDCNFCHPAVYVWNETLKTFEERKPGYE